MSHYNKDFVFVDEVDHNVIGYESNIAINRGISELAYLKLPSCSMNDYWYVMTSTPRPPKDVLI